MRNVAPPSRPEGSQRRSAVLVAYAWPPDSEVGALRPAKLAKYLLREGWTPVVVTVREDYAERVSADRTNELNGAIVLRTRRFPSPRDLYVGLKGVIGRLRGSARHTEQGIQTRTREATEMFPETLRGRVKRYLLSLVFTPDRYVGWIPFGVRATVAAIRKHKAETVITTGPPFTAHLIGWVVKRVTGVRWIADFRDPWSENKRPREIRAELSDRTIRWLRAGVVTAADTVVCVTPAMTDSFRKLYPGLADDKWVTITNGFDREDFADLASIPRPERFTVAYVGGFDYGRTPEPFLKVLGRMLRDGEMSRGDVSVRLVGDCRYAGVRSLEDMARDNDLKNVVEVLDFLPRRKALEEMAKADVLLLLVTNQQNEVPAKAYEYMAAGGKVLALTEDSIATTDVIRSTAVGEVLSPRDDDGIRRALSRWYKEYRERGMCQSRSPRDNLEAYEWSTLGERYAALLKNEAHPAAGLDEGIAAPLMLEKGKST